MYCYVNCCKGGRLAKLYMAYVATSKETNWKMVHYLVSCCNECKLENGLLLSYIKLLEKWYIIKFSVAKESSYG